MMFLVKIIKDRLQTMINDGWSCLFEDVFLFCMNHNINVPNMEDKFILQRKSACKAPRITHLHWYKVDIFCVIIDK
jgi:hypothetical protein